ncbi:unnamed protein product [Adineta steineri]|uniref:Uncharacterized protein n=1 Tax=Adineta steineri TaxID=433720 RepID=A0A819CXM0_9BILA|nr:unnamed protein product [Adineta steineri]
MGQLHSILKTIGFSSNTNTYHRIPTDELEENKNETFQQETYPRHCHHVTTNRADQNNLLIWLDENSNKFSLDIEYTKNIFCKIYPGSCVFYDQSHQFLTDIHNEKFQNNKILLIISGSLAKQVLHKINIFIVPVVIIFCSNYNNYMNLKSYSNVVDVCTDYETLKSLIQRELPSLKFCLSNNTPLKSLKSLVSTTRYDVNIGNETCFSYILIVDLIKQMPQTNESKKLWLEKCAEYYRGNQTKLKQIADFSKVYKADDAIKWYTKDSFCHKLTNLVLRIDDIVFWYSFRYYIVDLCKEIELAHKQQKYSEILTLYRGQSMSHEELKSIKELIDTDNLFCTTAFFSTSKCIEVAKGFIGGMEDCDDQRIPILFVITVDTINLKTVTFVDIEPYFAKKNYEPRKEDEILFTIGSIFRITAVERESENSKTWKIYMEATDDGSDMIQRQIDLMKNKYPNAGINSLFGRYLMDMNHLAKAKSYFQMLLHELDSPNLEQQYRIELIFINNSLGELHMRMTNYEQAYQYFKTAHTIQLKYNTTSKLFISDIFFGNYYKAIDHPLLAYEHYLDALSNMNKTAEENKINIIRLNMNIASINAICGDYHRSIEVCTKVECLLRIPHSTYSSHFEMIICQGLIGDNYFKKQDYNQAKSFYLNAFHKCEQYLYIGHRQLIHCIRSLVEVDRKIFNDNDKKAIDFCQKQLEQHRKHLAHNHSSIAHLLMKLGDIKQNVEHYKEALDILTHNDYLEYLTIAQCYKFIGDYYLKNIMNQNIEQAHDYFCKTREIYREIYPKDHRSIIEIEGLINSNR